MRSRGAYARPERAANAPAGNGDPRIPAYQDNFYQIGQGGRYFAWYGCQACHTDQSPGGRNLSDGRWVRGGGFADVFASIADGHGTQRYGTRIPVEQLWQLTAYARDLSQHHPEKRDRVARDQHAEPQGNSWSGPQ